MPLALKEGTDIFLPKPGKESYFEPKSIRIIVNFLSTEMVGKASLYHNNEGNNVQAPRTTRNRNPARE